MMESNMVGWFEIPVTDMDRAKKFYDILFEVDIQVVDFHGTMMGWFPWVEGKSGAAGSLVKNEAYRPSETEGVVIYFSCEDVNIQLGRVESAGGKIVQPKKLIADDIGYMGVIVDTEGNRIALHSRK